MKKLLIQLAWTDPAISDLDSIHAYISRDAEVYADSVIAEIFDAVDRLIQFPQSGRIVPEIKESNTREIIVGSYQTLISGMIHQYIEGDLVEK